MKHFLTTTAVIMSLSAPAFAESHSATTADAATSTSMDTSMMIGSVMAAPTDFYASDLIGMRIYNVEAQFDDTAPIADNAEAEWDDIGEINDIIVTADGKVSAVILGVGGFLGIGERDVSVPMSAIKVLTEEGDSDDRFLVVKSSKEELEVAPAFERKDM